MKNGMSGSDRYTWIRSPGGSTGWGSGDGKSQQLMSDLIQHDAAGLLSALIPGSETEASRSFNQVSNLWAGQDMEGYAAWVEDHREQEWVYRKGASTISNILSQKGEFEVAMEWAQSAQAPGEADAYRLMNIYSNWKRADPMAAAAWRNSDQFTGDPKRFPLPEIPESE